MCTVALTVHPQTHNYKPPTKPPPAREHNALAAGSHNVAAVATVTAAATVETG